MSYSSYTSIVLTPQELMRGMSDAALRHYIAQLGGCEDAYGCEEEESPWKHMLGVYGEMAYHNFRDKYWVGGVNTFKGPDAGTNVQIRARPRHDLDLTVRSRDNDNHYFVHITLELPEARIHGWIQGKDARRQEWLKAYSKRPPAFFVPKAALHPFTKHHESK